MVRFWKPAREAWLTGPFTLTVAFAMLAGIANADPYIRDDVNDTGAEPNVTASVMYLSPDIGVSNTPLAGWEPAPHSAASPPVWAQTLPSDNPDYRSPRSGQPNYIYVRVTNKGTATTGTERLYVYWASASSGLVWDPGKTAGSFVDNVQNNVLLGQEITKPRKDAAAASQAERDAYIAAVKKIATDPSLTFLGGTDYWRTQEQVHRFGSLNRHHTIAFLSWHRELLARYEGLLQEADPKVKLLYWNWTQSPRLPPLDYFTNTFMGASGYLQSSGVPIGAPLSPSNDGAYSILNHSTLVTRRLEQGQPPAEPDAAVLARTPFYDLTVPTNGFAYQLERISHDYSHPYIGGSWGSAWGTEGDMAAIKLSTRDPFFFLLHGKADELWARWQRQSLANFTPGTAFGASLNNDANLTDDMQPWNGAANADGTNPPPGAGYIEPWGPAGGEAYAKQARDRSVISPPIYDGALLTIPVLQPGQEVILEIPWYPPDPSTVGSPNDPGHVCLVARIETSFQSPYGMTVPETTDLGYNTQQNNNIAWRNVHVVDTFPGPFKKLHFIMRNVTREPVTAGLLMGAVVRAKGRDFAKDGTVLVDLGPELFKRWHAANKAETRGIAVLPDGILRVSAPQAAIKGIALRPGEEFPVRLTFALNRDYRPTAKGEPIAFDVVQTGLPGKPDAIAGGNRYNIDTEKLTYVRQGETWRWLPGFRSPPRDWMSPAFNDAAWYQRRLELGIQGLLAAGHDETSPAAYFRRTFDVDDTSFVRSLIMRVKRSDGAVVYLNGKEIYRSNMPDGAAGPAAFARAPVPGIERMAFFAVKLDRALLHNGRNVLAAEVHRARRAPDPTFDLELDANWEAPREAPYVEFTGIGDGSPVHADRPVTIDVGALSTAGEISRATLTIDGKAGQTLEKPPFRFTWVARSGPHRLVATVVDSNGLTSNAYATVTGVPNLPPVVQIVQPVRHIEIDAGGTLEVVAQASDPDGKIAAVDFYVDDRRLFTDKERFIGTDTTAPYSVTLKDLKPGDNMIMAIARDNEGARVTAVPVMVMVRARRGTGHQMP